MTIGLSPCMKATREFVVPRSIPTMRSVAIIQQSALSIQHSANPASRHRMLSLKHFTHVPNQIPDVRPSIQQVYHFVEDFAPAFLRSIAGEAVPFVPIFL